MDRRYNTRAFTEFEKDFINKIIEIGDNTDFPNLSRIMSGLWGFNEPYYVEGRAHDYILREGEIQYYKILGPTNANPNEYLTFLKRSRQIKEIVTYLLDNDYCIQRKSIRFLGIILGDNSNVYDSENETEEVFLYEDFKYLLRMLEYNIYPTEALNELVKNGFRTKQDIYNEMTRKISFGSMIAAVSSVVITLGLGILNYNMSTKVKEKSVLEIDSTTIKQIINETRSKSPIIIRDTIYLKQ